MKRKTVKILTVVLAVTMLMGVIVLPTSAAASSEPCNHHWVFEGEEEGTDCVFGPVTYQVWKCSICDATYHTAIRDREDPDSDTEGERPGSHEWEEKEIPSLCPKNPMKQNVCKVCNAIEYPTGGGHNWEVQSSTEATCTTEGVKTYRCTYCGETMEEHIHANGHQYDTPKTVAATCTTEGYTSQTCKICHEERKYNYVAPTGHTWNYDTDSSGNICAVCTVCGETKNHVFVGWKSDGTSHWRVCYICGEAYDKAPHTNKNGACTVCGYVSASPTTCRHVWKVEEGSWQNAGAVNTHIEKCVLCDATRKEACTPDYTTRDGDCTNPVYCACGRKLSDGQERHNFGTYICRDGSHVQPCLNQGCQYNHEEAHTFVTVSGVVKCSVCHYVDAAASAPHEHTFGAWTVGTNGCVTRCTDPTCSETVVTAHVAGHADCAGNAVCVNCGAPMKVAASAVHSGPTELRGYVAPEVGKAGYTGDTWCLKCGQISVKGTTIPALEPGHVHNFNRPNHDATGHWMECACGEHEAAPAAHTGGRASCAGQAVCEVCGEKYGALDAGNHVGGTEIVNSMPAQIGVAGYTGDTHCLGCGALLERGTAIPALEDSHQHAYALKSDSLHHWQECACGDKHDVAAHTYANGVCTVCNAAEPEKVETHVHTFSAKWSANSLAHWHTCTVCGTESDVAEHIFIDGKCAGCGMSYFAYEQEAANEQAPKPPVTEVFADVAADPVKGYYVENVQRLYDAGIMSGSRNGKGEWVFDVDSNISHIEVQLVLARIYGVEGTYGADWDEVVKMTGDWAEENGFLSGGDSAVSRQEMFYNLWKLAGSPQSTMDLGAFADSAEVSDEYLDAVRWTVEAGIVTGSSELDGKLYLKPNAEILRKDAATVVVRYVDAANIVI